MTTAAMTTAKLRLVHALLDILAADYEEDHTSSSDAEAELADERLAHAALTLVEAVDAAPADSQPVGWRENAASPASPARVLLDDIADAMGGWGALIISTGHPVTSNPDGVTSRHSARLTAFTHVELDGRWPSELDDDDRDADCGDDGLIGEGDTPDEAVTELHRRLSRLTSGTIERPTGYDEHPRERRAVAWDRAAGALTIAGDA